MLNCDKPFRLIERIFPFHYLCVNFRFWLFFQLREEKKYLNYTQNWITFNETYPLWHAFQKKQKMKWALILLLGQPLLPLRLLSVNSACNARGRTDQSIYFAKCEQLLFTQSGTHMQSLRDRIYLGVVWGNSPSSLQSCKFRLFELSEHIK